MREKICVVTGATDGIGLETARGLAAQGARVVLVGRDRDKAERQASSLRQATGNTALSVEIADLSRPREVRALSQRLHGQLPHIDVLINNAGAYFAERQETADGLERTFALNHLSYVLLTDLSLDLLRAAPAGRVVLVASAAHRRTDLDLDDLEMRRQWNGWLAYRRSKLMNIMHGYALARRLEGTGITANSLHPGFVRSKFGHNNAGLAGLVMRLGQSVAAISMPKGARTSLHVASHREGGEVSGRYFSGSRLARSSRQSLDEAAQERLWEVTQAVLSRHT